VRNSNHANASAGKQSRQKKTEGLTKPTLSPFRAVFAPCAAAGLRARAFISERRSMVVCMNTAWCTVGEEMKEPTSYSLIAAGLRTGREESSAIKGTASSPVLLGGGRDGRDWRGPATADRA
jgi:hypothetical protein